MYSFYINCTSEKSTKQILKYLFDSNQWLKHFQNFKNNYSSRKRLMRILIQIGTIDSLLRKNPQYLKNFFFEN